MSAAGTAVSVPRARRRHGVGSGLAVVVLKPLQAVIDDGDDIHAVIRGTAVNNDGAMKIGLRCTESAGQPHVIAREAYAVADVETAIS